MKTYHIVTDAQHVEVIREDGIIEETFVRCFDDVTYETENENGEMEEVDDLPTENRDYSLALKEFYHLLSICSAVIIDDSGLCYPSLYELNGDSENEFAYFSWDDNGDDYGFKLNEGCSDSIKFDGAKVTVNDHEGDEFVIQPLMPYSINNPTVI